MIMSGVGNKSPGKYDLVKEKLIAGSKQCPYKLAVVGGGPSGCSVIIRAFRIGYGGELCGFCSRKPAIDKDGKNILADAQFPFQSAGVCLIDQSSAGTFGGGKLQNYIINANTWANKFVTNVMDDKPDVVPQESVTGTPFQRLGAAQTAITLKGYGCKPAPLPMVGAFLRDAGAVVIETLNNKYPDSSRCLLETSVTALQQVMLPVPAQYEPDLPDRNSLVGSCVGWKLTLSQASPGSPGGKMHREIYAHKVVLATGGRQELPRLPNPAHTRKLLSSDYVCTQKGLDELRSRLVKAGLAANRTTPGRVVIIGGSHSAFSAAWLCLHRLNSDNYGSTATGGGGGATTPAQESKANSSSSGGGAGEDSNAVLFCQSGICLVHKSSIKVFYCTKSDADKDGYVIESYNPASSTASLSSNGAPGSGAKAANAVAASAASSSAQVSKSWVRGQIHPFGGIRGDAKELWRAARDGREPRVKLIQVRQNVSTVGPGATGLGSNAQPLKQQAIVEKLFDEAVVIVWACGYNTNLSMPVLDLHGVPVSMRVKCGQVEVDDHARIVSASPTIGVMAPTAAAPATVTVLPVASMAHPSVDAILTHVPAIAVADAVEPTLASVLAQLGDSSLLLNSEAVGEEKAPRSDSDATPPAPLGSPAPKSSLPGSPHALSTKLRLEIDTPVIPGSSSPAIQPAVAAAVIVPVSVPVPASPASMLAPAALVASPPPVAFRGSALSGKIVAQMPPAPPVIEGLMGSGLGFGLQALLESGLPDGSSGRADGVAVYLKRGATLVLAQVLGTRVFGGPDIKSWEDRLKLIKRLQLVASANVVKNADSCGGVSTSLDAGQSLLGSPSAKRPSTTAGGSSVRNSYSGVGFASPGGAAGNSGKDTPARAGSVLNRAFASRQNSTEKASPKMNIAGGGTTPSGKSAFTFPEVSYGEPSPSPSIHKVGDAWLTPVRPATASSALSPGSGGGGGVSPKTAISFIAHSPEAQRCSELVEKVATLSADLEHLQLEGAREFLAIPAEGSAASSPIVPSRTVIAVSSTASTAASTSPANRGRSVSPAAIPRTSSIAAVKANDVASGTKPPMHGRAVSSGRTGSGGGTTTGVLVPKPTANAHARVVLTPLSADLKKRAATGESLSSGSSNSSSTTPRQVRVSGSAGSSSASTPRGSSGRALSRPNGTSSNTSTTVTHTAPPVAVLRSNSLTTGQASLAKAATSSPRAAAKSTSPVPSSSGAAAVVTKRTVGIAAVAPAPAPAGTVLQGKNAKLELPSIPQSQHKRSQNQQAEESTQQPRMRAPSIVGSSSRDAPGGNGGVDKLLKAHSVGTAASGKLSVAVV